MSKQIFGKAFPEVVRIGSEWYKEKRGKTISIDATVVNSKNNKIVGGDDE